MITSFTHIPTCDAVFTFINNIIKLYIGMVDWTRHSNNEALGQKH